MIRIRWTDSNTHPEEFTQCGVVWLAWFSLDVFLPRSGSADPSSCNAFRGKSTKSFVNQNLKTSSIRPKSSSDVPMLQGASAKIPHVRCWLPTWRRSRVYLSNSNILPVVSLIRGTKDRRLSVAVPRFGVGSRSCAGKEKRTEAMSATPMNLETDTPKPIST
jgi:hypothetical protein